MTDVHACEDPELERMEQAADWLIRLNEAPGDESLVSTWVQWCDEHPENLAAFRRAQAAWLAAAPRDKEVAVAGKPSEPVSTPERRVRGTTVSLRWATAAALAAVAIVGARLAMLHGADAGLQSYATPVAGSGSGVLPDGSKVELGARSRITTQYTAKVRGVAVDSGEAFFTVARDPARPFVVTAGHVQVIAVGTAFDVRRDDDRTVVAVTEGKVKITRTEPSQPSPENTESAFFVPAGQEAMISQVSPRVAVVPLAPPDEAYWRQGVFKYMGEPLSGVVSDLNRYSGRRIVVTDPKLRELPFTGTVFSGRIVDALHAFEDVFPLQVIERDAEIELAPQRVSSSANR